MALKDILEQPDKRAGKDKRIIDPDKDVGINPQKIGKRFEDQIQSVCDLYLTHNIAYIQRYYVPTLFIKNKKNPNGTMIYRSKTGFDFVGGIMKTKEAIFIEAKSTATGLIPVGADKTGIKAHQLEAMLMLHKSGLKCMFLWQIRDAKIVYKFNPTQLIDAIGTRKSLTILLAQESHFSVVIPTQIGLAEYYDFLGEL
jgi:penicillin-binding protein-related factor A (putative recombinase)